MQTTDKKLTLLRPLSHRFLNLSHLLALLAVARLEPALGRVVLILALVLGGRWQELGEPGDVGRFALLRRVVGGRHPAQGRPRREEREEIGRETVRHRCVLLFGEFNRSLV